MSTPINDGGPAFPHFQTDPVTHRIEVCPQGGMTLRDYFAGQALAGSIANKLWDDFPLPEHAEECYRFADAMLSAREAQK